LPAENDPKSFSFEAIDGLHSNTKEATNCQISATTDKRNAARIKPPLSADFAKGSPEVPKYISRSTVTRAGSTPLADLTHATGRDSGFGWYVSFSLIHHRTRTILHRGNEETRDGEGRALRHTIWVAVYGLCHDSASFARIRFFWS